MFVSFIVLGGFVLKEASAGTATTTIATPPILKGDVLSSLEQEMNSGNPFLIESSGFLTDLEAQMYRQVPLDELDGKIPVPKALMERFLASFDQIEERDTCRSLQNIEIYQDVPQDEEIVYARRKRIRASTDLHQDNYREGRHSGESAKGHTAFVFLNTNEDAYFLHGSTRVAIEAGKMVVFDSNVPHRTILLNEQARQQGVDLLGPFDTDHLVAVGGIVLSVKIDGVAAPTSAPGPTLTGGDTVTFTYELSNFVTELVAVYVTDDMLGVIDCPSTMLGIGSMTCEATAEVMEGQYMSTARAFGFAESNDEPYATFTPVYYTGTEKICDGLFCSLHKS